MTIAQWTEIRDLELHKEKYKRKRIKRIKKMCSPSTFNPYIKWQE